MLIRTRAPLRISFGGGGTDVPPYPAMEGGCVLSATVARYAYGTLRPRTDGRIRIESVDYGLTVSYDREEELVYDGRLDLVKAAILRQLKDRGAGFDLFLHSDAPPGSGLGASSALAVVLIGLLREFANQPWSDYEVAGAACHLERSELGIPGGFQDQYAATFGGFNYIEFTGERVIVNPLRLTADIQNELQHNLLLCYTGETRVSGGIIADQSHRYETGETLHHLREMKRITMEMKNALFLRRYGEFGHLLHEEWVAKRSLSPRISTPKITEMYAAATDAGAIGGKVTGAGGGGYMLLYCPFDRKHAVASRLAELGAVPTDFTFEPLGLQTWRCQAESAEGPRR